MLSQYLILQLEYPCFAINYSNYKYNDLNYCYKKFFCLFIMLVWRLKNINLKNLEKSKIQK